MNKKVPLSLRLSPICTFSNMPSNSQSNPSLAKDIWAAYSTAVPDHLKPIDVFLCYVLLVGIIQFVYVLFVGTFPFNSFLAGFISAVGVFVLTVSLRLQLSPNNLQDPANRWGKLTKRRAVIDYLFCNLILHMAVLNFLG